MHEGYCADAIITLGGCDKTVPGVLMPIARLNLIGLSMFGGPALPGVCKDLKFTEDTKKNLDPADIMQAIGAYPHGTALFPL
jgi:dihydroxy-acid dehydratase